MGPIKPFRGVREKERESWDTYACKGRVGNKVRGTGPEAKA